MAQEKFLMKYSPELDGLRGVSILSIMAWHARVPFLPGGFIAVDIFFVLSGFLITALLISEYDRHGSVSLKNFYMRRVLRLAPALLLFLTIFCLFSFLFISHKKATSNYIDSLITLFYVTNWARAFDIHPPHYLGHTWTLSVEEQFYMVWPILLLTVLRLFNRRTSVVIFAMSISVLAWALRAYLYANGATVMRLYNGSDTRADSLMVGCAFGIAYASGLFEKHNRKDILLKILPIAGPVATLLLLVIAAKAVWAAPYMYQFLFFVVEILIAILIIDVTFRKNCLTRKVLAASLLVWVGKISYGVYLWHFPIYQLMQSLGFKQWFIVITVGSLITFIVAASSYYLMERPILKFKQKLCRRPSDISIRPVAAVLHPTETPDVQGASD